MIKLVVSKNDSEQTLINFLKKIFKEEPLSRIYYLFYKKKIRVNNKRVTSFKYLLKQDDLIEIYDNTLKLSDNQLKVTRQPEINIAYQDHQILVVIKDHNLLVHSIHDLSLDNMVRYYFQTHQSELVNQQTFIISHQYRLDKLTKGLVIYPKTRRAQQILVKAQEEDNLIKKYYAIIEGKITKEIDASGFIYHDEEQQKMIFSESAPNHFAKPCQTIFTSIISKDNLSLIECQLITGRKHQIRATLAYFKVPIVGDYKYGSNIIIKEKIFLFAYYISFKDLPSPLDYLNGQVITLKGVKEELVEIVENNLFKNNKLMVPKT